MPIVNPNAAPPPATVPGPPTLLAASAADSLGLASWAAPASNGGSAVTSYQVVTRRVSSGAVSLTQVTGPLTLSQVVAPLTNGIAYSVTVVAVNAVGASAPSNSITVTPVADGGTQPPPPPPPPPPAYLQQPVVAAFPVGQPFAPANWVSS